MTSERGKTAEVEGEFPSIGETAAEMLGTMNMILRNVRDQGQEDLEADEYPNGGPSHEQNFLWNWSNVEYSDHVAARQDAFDRIFEGADRLIANATPSGTAELERDEEAAWGQTQVLMQGVVDQPCVLQDDGSDALIGLDPATVGHPFLVEASSVRASRADVLGRVG
jgi:hypothetical protein